MNISKLDLDFDYLEVGAEEQDCRELDPRKLANMLFQLFLIRDFEENLLDLSAKDCIHGPVHTSIGEEACAIGTMAAIGSHDKILSTHRAHHHYLAKAGAFCAEESGFDPLGDDLPPEMQQHVTTLMGEIMGLKIGCCGGRGGSMHLRNAEIGVVGTNAIVGGGLPLAAGAAFAEKYNRNDSLAVCFLGDGAANQGSFHEALNLAGLWDLPIIYFVENNKYAVGTSVASSAAVEYISERARAYNMSAIRVDGMDTMAVFAAVAEAAKRVRDYQRPIMIEALCYRYFHHAGPLPGSGYGYRDKAEEEIWHARDPYEIFPNLLVSNAIFSIEQVQAIKEKACRAVASARAHCTREDNGATLVPADLQPDPLTVVEGLRSDGGEFLGVKYAEADDFSEFETTTYVEAIAAVTGRNMEKDARVFVLGEEVANLSGGPYGATKGPHQAYPERVLNTPISECGFIGLAGGACMSGLRPIVEIMFPDFALVAADQLFNQIGKLRHMYGNTTDMPLVARTRIAVGCGYGGQHSMDPVGLFSLFSGWTVVAPSTAFDYIGLFNSAMLSRDPVLMVEHHQLYSRKFEVPQGDLDYFVELGRARRLRTGRDVTVLCHSISVPLVMQAVAELSEEGVDAEVLDLRTVSPNDIDYEAIGSSLRKTGAIVVVEQAAASLSVGSAIAARCQREFFDYLDAPIVQVAGLDIPNPVSKVLESAAVPAICQIKQRIMESALRKV